jgi:hypothetical protein
MPSTAVERTRALLFAVCAACTLWLIAQNAFLFALLPATTWPAAIRSVIQAAHVVMSWAVPLVLVPLAFALGWLASRRASTPTRGGAS